MSDVIKSYLAKIDREFKTGRATEHTHRPALKDLIESLDSGVRATNEPKRVECGAPDFILRRDGLSIGSQKGNFGAKVEIQPLSQDSVSQSYCEHDCGSFLAVLKKIRKNRAVYPSRQEPSETLLAELEGLMGKLRRLLKKIDKDGQADRCQCFLALEADIRGNWASSGGKDT